MSDKQEPPEGWTRDEWEAMMSNKQESQDDMTQARILVEVIRANNLERAREVVQDARRTDPEKAEYLKELNHRAYMIDKVAQERDRAKQELDRIEKALREANAHIDFNGRLVVP